MSRTSVDDVLRHQPVAPVARMVLVNPVGLVPVFSRDDAEGDVA